MQTCSPRFGLPGTGRAAAGLHFGLRASVSAPQYGNRAPVRPSTPQVGWYTFPTIVLLTLFAATCIAVFPILADVVEVKTGSGSTAHWPIHLIRLNGWLRHSFAQLITLLDIDGIGQNWEDSNN